MTFVWRQQAIILADVDIYVVPYAPDSNFTGIVKKIEPAA